MRVCVQPWILVSCCGSNYLTSGGVSAASVIGGGGPRHAQSRHVCLQSNARFDGRPDPVNHEGG